MNYKWFNFGGNLAGILDSGSLWNFRYRCVKGGIREPLAKRRWWRHLANSFALVEVPALSECFLVVNIVTILHIEFFAFLISEGHDVILLLVDRIFCPCVQQLCI